MYYLGNYQPIQMAHHGRNYDAEDDTTHQEADERAEEAGEQAQYHLAAKEEAAQGLMTVHLTEVALDRCGLGRKTCQ
jgi:hypothetical protein